MSLDNFNPYDPYGKSRGQRNAGFRVGFVAGWVMIALHVLLLLMFGLTNQGDIVAWITAWFVYYMAARSAAEQQYRSQINSLESLRGVQGAGVGGALITSLMVWGFIIARAVFRDAVGIRIVVDPISLYCVAVVDILIAIGLGSAGGNAVVKKYSTRL